MRNGRSAPESAALQLLRQLANGASSSDLIALGAPETERDLALRIRTGIERRRRREAELAALVETAQDLASLRDPGGVLDAIVRRARTLLGTDLAYLTLYDPDEGDTYMRATDGSVAAAFQVVRLSLGDGLGGLAASTHRAYWTADYFADRRFQHTGPIDSAVADEGIVAICGTPLLVEDTFVGVLFAANRSPRPFAHDEVALLGSLAALAAVTLVQVRALRETEQALAALSQAHSTVRRHVAGVERAAAAHDRFAELVLAGGGVDDITAALADLLGGWVVLLDERGVSRSRAGGAPAGSLDPAGPDPLADGPLARAAAASGRLVRSSDGCAVRVTAAHEHLGLLVLGGLDGVDGPPRLDEPDERTVERAAVVTALVLLFERQALDAQHRTGADLVAELLARRGDRTDRVRAARAQGLDTQQPWCLLVLRAGATVGRRTLALSAASAIGGSGVVGEHEGDVVVLAAGDDAGGLARTVASRLSSLGPVTVAGVGPVDDLDDLQTAHHEAVRTVGALVALGHEGTGAGTVDLGFAGLIVGSDPDVTSYVRRVLGAVIAYDETRGTSLVETLEAYFAAGASPRHAATVLHVHTNTVTQRLERVGVLLGPTWAAPDQALELQLALRLRHLVAGTT